MLVDWRGIDRVESCKEFVREIKVSDRVESCKEFVRRNVRYLIELRVVRSLLEGFRGILIELRTVRSLLVELRGIR